jgi:group II intron reverse transcriptase/maturase
LGQPVYLTGKPGGDNSILETSGMSEGMYGMVRLDPCVTVKAKLLELQSPVVEFHTHRLPCIKSGAAEDPGSIGRPGLNTKEYFALPGTSVQQTMTNEVIQGDKWSTYNTLYIPWLRNTGSPKGRETYGDGAPIVLRGRESRLQGEGGQELLISRIVEVREMRKAETILGIIRDRGERGLPVEDLYRQLFNPDLYLKAYGKISSNKGAMTKGVTPETVDGMCLEKIHLIIEAIRSERYRWTPVRRTHIPKGNGKTRPLGIPTWSDKLVQEVIRMILETYYEPQFSDHSHGFRPQKGCHTALRETYYSWKGTTWFIEGDISGCFDNIDHEILMSILKEKIQDNRFLELIKNLLGAGYLEDWKYNKTLSGTPQGGIVSPILSNIYLDQLDKYVEGHLIPEFNRGKKKRMNPEYTRMHWKAYELSKQGQYEEANQLRRESKQLSSIDPQDPNYRRLRYVRYADDFLLGVVGPKDEAEEIKRQLSEFLADSLKLELSREKTLITHGRTEAARFLGYDLTVNQSNDKLDTKRYSRAINGRVGMKVPIEVIKRHGRSFKQNGKPIHRREWVDDSIYSIISRYQTIYRGIVNYYRMAYNLHRLDELKYVMEVSLTKTLASKLKISVSQVYKKFGKVLQTSEGDRKVLEHIVEREGKKPLTARWGNISLKWNPRTELDDCPGSVWNVTRTEVEQRIQAEECALCHSKEDIQVHHIRALEDLFKRGRPAPPGWKQTMASRKRKSLEVCRTCHIRIHSGQYDGTSLSKT